MNAIDAITIKLNNKNKQTNILDGRVLQCGGIFKYNLFNIFRDNYRYMQLCISKYTSGRHGDK